MAISESMFRGAELALRAAGIQDQTERNRYMEALTKQVEEQNLDRADERQRMSLFRQQATGLNPGSPDFLNRAMGLMIQNAPENMGTFVSPLLANQLGMNRDAFQENLARTRPTTNFMTGPDGSIVNVTGTPGGGYAAKPIMVTTPLGEWGSQDWAARTGETPAFNVKHELFTTMDGVNPDLAEIVHIVAKEHPEWGVTVTSGKRTNEKQKDIYARKGQPGIYTPAVPGTSPHEYGRGMDLTANVPASELNREIQRIAAERGVAISWGGGKDPVHWQINGYGKPLKTAKTAGKVWIHDPKTKVKRQVSPDEADQLEAQGWTRGQAYGGESSDKVWVHHPGRQVKMQVPKGEVQNYTTQGWVEGQPYSTTSNIMQMLGLDGGPVPGPMPGAAPPAAPGGTPTTPGKTTTIPAAPKEKKVVRMYKDSETGQDVYEFSDGSVMRLDPEE